MKSTKILPAMAVAPFLLALWSCSAFVYWGDWGSYSKTLHTAEELTRQERYAEAIALYEKHIASRLALKVRPEWENPHFYQILIADLYIRMEDPESALKALDSAHSHAVDKGLISDRYRMIAGWYAGKEQYNKGLEVLKRYREIDPLLFDISMDRIARSAVAHEDALQSSP